MSQSDDVASFSLFQVYDHLFDAYGAQHWWPAETPFEVMLGAVLTQNTAWRNVERAISNLTKAGLMSPDKILQYPQQELAQLIRPSGYFNVKADRLKNLCRFIVQQGGLENSGRLSTAELRKALLAVKGVGPETADDILLYAYQRPVFVIDAYTRRVFSRLGLVSGKESYETLRSLLEHTLNSDADYYNEYHALIVRHSKEACQKKPRCGACVLESNCAYAKK